MIRKIHNVYPAILNAIHVAVAQKMIVRRVKIPIIEKLRINNAIAEMVI